MRLQRYLLAECLVLASAVLGATLLVRTALRLSIAEGRGPARSLTEKLAQARPGSGTFDDRPYQLSLPGVSQEAAGTFMGLEDDVLVARMRSQPIVRMKLNKGGSSLSFRVDFADGSRAAFKPAQTNLQTVPRREVAAYRINRLLGLNGVAPATPRMVTRSEMFSHLHPDTVPMLPRIRTETMFDPRGNTAGVMMFWIPAIKDAGLDNPEGIAQSTQWLTHGQPIPEDKHSLVAQLSDLLVFDFLISNPDRYSGGNMLTNGDGTRLYYMDNTLSFFLDPDGSEKTRAELHRGQRFSRRLYQALDRISDDSLGRILSQASEGDYEILTRAEIRAVVSRRDYVKAYIGGLVSKYGPSEVFYFP
jgi:hypothetical protein